MRIRNQVFVVTGAGSGIGQAVVLELLSRGARIGAVDRRPDGLAETAARAQAQQARQGQLDHLAATGRLTTYALDITDRAAVEALPSQVVADHGTVDGLLNIAGIIQRFVPLDEMTLEEIERVMDVNFWGTLYMDLAFLPLLKARPQAALINVASMGALVPVPGQSVYDASKGAVKVLTEGLYAELRDTSVAVTVVFPGGTNTGIAVNSGVQAPNLPPDKIPKILTPEEAAKAIVDAVEKGTFRVVIGRDAHMLDRLSRIAPQRAISIVAERMKSYLG